MGMIGCGWFRFGIYIFIVLRDLQMFGRCLKLEWRKIERWGGLENFENF